MIPIYICDDDLTLLSHITEQVKKCCMIETLNFEIKEATSNPHYLLYQLEKNQQQGIYFLDVDLSDNALNGFELGKSIRKLDPRGFIVYITAHAEFLPETFKYRVEALDYILKDEADKMNERIQGALKEIANILQANPQQSEEVYTVETASRILHIPVSEIYYFETTYKKNVVMLRAKWDNAEFYGSLNELEAHFGDKFFRTHQSYLVNVESMKIINKREKTVELIDGSTCLVARRKLKGLQQVLEEIKNNTKWNHK